jgi:hypothetical protein
MTMNLMIPTVHMNGTSRKELADQLEHAVRAIDTAMEAMREACPHDRDYYLQGPTAGPAAREQHRNRLRRLEAVQAEIYTIYEGVVDSDNPYKGERLVGHTQYEPNIEED